MKKRIRQSLKKVEHAGRVIIQTRSRLKEMKSPVMQIR